MGGWEAKCWTSLRIAHAESRCAHGSKADELPETAASEKQIERLVDKTDAAGLKPEDLDEIVHEFAASIAADVNNGGLEEQIRYLVEGMGAQHTERQIERVDRKPTKRRR